MTLPALFDLMVQKVNELLDIHKGQPLNPETREKHYEIQLIQKVIKEKRDQIGK